MNWQTNPVGCSVTVSFSSIGSGIAAPTHDRMEDLLERDAAVITVQRYLRGREGEIELCIHVKDDADIERLFRVLKAMVLPKAKGRGVSIKTNSGLTFTNEG